MAGNWSSPLLLILAYLSVAQATSPAASTLYLSQTDTVFSLNIAENSNDTYIHFESPSNHNWIAIGAGYSMKNTLYFMIYPSKGSKNVTFSPRISTGDIEPVYEKSIDFEILTGTTVQNKRLNLNAVCHNCRSWKGGSLNITSTSQTWMYAFGPSSNPIESDSLTAGLTQHQSYGWFSMDMLQATGPSGVPESQTTPSLTGVQLIGRQFVSAKDIISTIHGYTMASLVIILVPLLILHDTSKIRFQWINWTLFALVSLLALVTGFWDSILYNRSKNFKSPHQIIGFIILVLLFISLTLSLLSHHFSKHTPPSDTRITPTTTPQPAKKPHILSRIAKPIAHTAWLLALIDGFIGIHFASPKTYIYAIYACCIVGMIAILVPSVLLLRRYKLRKELRSEMNGVMSDNEEERLQVPEVPVPEPVST